ncbi:hypothetical protein JCM10908_002359 [Rhodotorula pacifica]|uniref:uncharacterized protein n=1 Tax=Rhodotorula pacifica TaxID=1495444 RepID=UPI00316EA878
MYIASTTDTTVSTRAAASPTMLHSSSGPVPVILDQFNSLLSTLKLPIHLPSLSLATPTLLLTVLEAILETRIIDVPSTWRANPDPNTRIRIGEIVLRAIEQVVDGIARKTGALPPLQAQARVAARVAEGDAETVASVLETLLWIADALDIKSRPPARSPRSRLGALGRAEPNGNADSAAGPPSSKLFSPRPLRYAAAIPPSPTKSALIQRPRAVLSDSPSTSQATLAHARPPSVAASEPAALSSRRQPAPPPPSQLSPPATPTQRRQRPTISSFLAQLARTRSPDQASTISSSSGARGSVDRALVRSPPGSPRKSIVEVMRSLEQQQRRERGAGAAAGKGTAQRVEHKEQQRGRRREGRRSSESSEGDLGDGARRTSSESSAASGSTPDSPPGHDGQHTRRSPAASLPSKPLPPCTCTPSSRSSTSLSPRDTSASSSSSSAESSRPRRSGTLIPSSAESPRSPVVAPPAKQLSHRIRVSRLSPPRTPRDGNEPEAGQLSVHSSTDLDSPLPAPSSSPSRARVRGVLSTPASQPATIMTVMGETPSPYTLLLLAHRDRLREKLRVLERRERDRKAAAVAAAAAAMAGNGDTIQPVGQGAVAQDGRIAEPRKVAA